MKKEKEGGGGERVAVEKKKYFFLFSSLFALDSLYVSLLISHPLSAYSLLQQQPGDVRGVGAEMTLGPLSLFSPSSSELHLLQSSSPPSLPNLIENKTGGPRRKSVLIWMKP